ncbi:MAG TPA: SMI1/KNR4 family protein [Ktedonobacteraceae bacterium]
MRGAKGISFAPRDNLNKLRIPQKFAFPPATEEQIEETERLLGFPLYPFLRELYTQIANGGFGPGYGLNGIIGGFENGGLGPMIERYREDKPSASERKTDPAQFLELCHWGCAVYSYLENKTGRIYHMTDDEKYECDAPSLEAWLELRIIGGV